MAAEAAMQTARYFDLDDGPTNKMLAYLDALSRWHSGTAEHFDGWLTGAVREIGMLPSAVRRHFNDWHYRTCGAYFGATPERREAKWRELARHLGGELDAVLADPALAKGSGTNLKDRPTTLGERIHALCNELWEALQHGGDADKLAVKLQG
jgi:hypothetical protein